MFDLTDDLRASNVSHTVVLRPLKAGYFNFTSASVSYLAQEGGQVVVGYTSAPGQGGILAQREFDRRFSPHYLDWAAFGVMTLPPSASRCSSGTPARESMTPRRPRRTDVTRLRGRAEGFWGLGRGLRVVRDGGSARSLITHIGVKVELNTETNKVTI
uniref:Signal sequence receptor subunit 2 n=1 Tax=Labrus bergylta TaxID=56723 RepID=A0A3Q3E2Y7_9LABR